MLDTLDTVPWQKLTHAYGSASDIPELLHKLDAGSRQDRDSAATRLGHALAHQGTVYSASPRTVPFVLELLQQGTNVDHARLLRLLIDLIFGATYGGLTSLRIEERFNAPDGQWVRAAYEAGRTGVAHVSGRLRNRSPSVRAAAAYALGWFPDDARTLAPAFCEALESEADASVRASLLLALGRANAVLGVSGDDARFNAALRAQGPSERVAGAVALYYRFGDGLPSAAVDVLIAAGRAGEHDAELPWDDGDLGRLSVRVLGSLGAKYEDVAVDAILSALPSQPRSILTLLARVFPSRRRTSGPMPASQRRVLEAIARQDDLWVHVGELGLLMDELGLPSDPVALGAFLGIERSPSVLDRMLEIETQNKNERLPVREVFDRLARGEDTSAEALLAALQKEPVLVRWDIVSAAAVHWSSATCLDAFLLAAVGDIWREDPTALAREIDLVARRGLPSVLVDRTFSQPTMLFGYLAAAGYDAAAASGVVPDQRLDQFAIEALGIESVGWLVERVARLPAARQEAIIAALERAHATQSVADIRAGTQTSSHT